METGEATAGIFEQAVVETDEATAKARENRRKTKQKRKKRKQAKADSENMQVKEMQVNKVQASDICEDIYWKVDSKSEAA